MGFDLASMAVGAEVPDIHFTYSGWADLLETIECLYGWERCEVICVQEVGEDAAEGYLPGEDAARFADALSLALADIEAGLPLRDIRKLDDSDLDDLWEMVKIAWLRKWGWAHDACRGHLEKVIQFFRQGSVFFPYDADMGLGKFKEKAPG